MRFIIILTIFVFLMLAPHFAEASLIIYENQEKGFSLENIILIGNEEPNLFVYDAESRCYGLDKQEINISYLTVDEFEYSLFNLVNYMYFEDVDLVYGSGSSQNIIGKLSETANIFDADIVSETETFDKPVLVGTSNTNKLVKDKLSEFSGYLPGSSVLILLEGDVVPILYAEDEDSLLDLIDDFNSYFVNLIRDNDCVLPYNSYGWLMDDDSDGALNDDDLCPNTAEKAVLKGCSCKQILSYDTNSVFVKELNKIEPGIYGRCQAYIKTGKELFSPRTPTGIFNIVFLVAILAVIVFLLREKKRWITLCRYI